MLGHAQSAGLPSDAISLVPDVDDCRNGFMLDQDNDDVIRNNPVP
jgi:hypothetical protein